jgi:hypothetical protein
MNTKTFSSFTAYFTFLEDLKKQGYLHSNEEYGSIPKGSKFVQTSRAGPLFFEIIYS